MEMTSNKPYLVRAFYEWIVDNNLTPYLVVNATLRGVKVPQQHVQNGQIVLNINPSAIGNLQMGNDIISFNARFGGQPFALSVPLKAVLAIYARENGAGTMFEAETEEDDIELDSEEHLPEPPEPTSPAGKKVSHLKVIK
ncbi:ClpXP protease specificity-enhancing factor [Rheinheimera sp.]|uniref:ClpXP protease specificity-enhancing factor n=1 Tax=Rheinheimera sp. TaxID=1869214 RepID=UPI00307F32F1